MMMKGVLSGFETLKVCTSTTIKEKYCPFPYNIEPENVTPVYQEFKGWKQETGMRLLMRNYQVS
jgi:adenylosuccinate synthase